MAMRILAGIGGFAVVLIGAWYNISASEAPSLFAPAAIIFLGCAIGSGCGGPIVGAAFNRGNAKIGTFLLLTILAGEGVVIINTMNRTLRVEDAAKKPLIEAAERHAEALNKLAAAESAVKALASAEAKSARLTSAKASLDAANKAMTDQSSAKNCLKNCAAMLTAAAAAARHELEVAQQAAEDELQAARQNAQEEKHQAQKYLAANPLPASANPLADRLGVEPWKIDIAQAVLLSLAINGLGMGFLAFAFHGHSRKPDPAPRRQKAEAHQAADVIELTPVRKTSRTANSNTKSLPSPAALQAARFGKDRLRLTDNGDIALGDILKGFTRWADDNNEPMPSTPEVAAGFRTVFERLGVNVVNGRVIGLAFKDEERREDAA